MRIMLRLALSYQMMGVMNHRSEERVTETQKNERVKKQLQVFKFAVCMRI